MNSLLEVIRYVQKTPGECKVLVCINHEVEDYEVPHITCQRMPQTKRCFWIYIYIYISKYSLGLTVLMDLLYAIL